MRRTYIITNIFFALCIFFSRPSYAEQFVDDGFQTAKKFESRYFTIFVERGVDLQKLAMKISIPPGIKAIIKDPIPSSSLDSPFNQLDLLFLAVSEIMDIRLANFKCKVKICNSASRLSEIANRLFGSEIQTGGFYVMAIDTLYVDAENVNIHILGHEFSHAVQCSYFVIPPPVKIQEVLAGYVEFQLRKCTHSLP